MTEGSSHHMFVDMDGGGGGEAGDNKSGSNYQSSSGETVKALGPGTLRLALPWRQAHIAANVCLLGH